MNQRCQWMVARGKAKGSPKSLESSCRDRESRCQNLRQFIQQLLRYFSVHPKCVPTDTSLKSQSWSHHWSPKEVMQCWWVYCQKAMEFSAWSANCLGRHSMEKSQAVHSECCVLSSSCYDHRKWHLKNRYKSKDVTNKTPFGVLSLHAAKEHDTEILEIVTLKPHSLVS